MLDHIITLTQNTDEELIQLLIDKTKIELEASGKKYSEAWDNVIEDIVILKLNRLNTEGLSSSSVNGFTETYSSSYPSYITNQLRNLGFPASFSGCIGRVRIL